MDGLIRWGLLLGAGVALFLVYREVKNRMPWN